MFIIFQLLIPGFLAKTHNTTNVQHEETILTMYRTWPNSLRWGRISPPPNPNLVFLPFSSSKFSLLRQKKWNVKICTCSGLWVEPCFFTNLRLKMHDKRDTSSKFYLCSWTSIWRMRNFWCKVVIGKASLRTKDAVSMLTLSWNFLYRTMELQLQKEKMKMVETVRVITGQVLGHG